MNNLAYIYQPHFMTDTFRVSCKEQLGDEFNYIVVTSSPTYNGLWKWESKYKDSIEKWFNGKLACYCVPIKMCTKIKNIDEITNPEVLSVIKSMQSKWKKKEVKRS